MVYPFRMKKRIHWSPEGGEAMVKVKQEILNETLLDVYLKRHLRSERKQREVKKAVRMSKLLIYSSIDWCEKRDYKPVWCPFNGNRAIS
jgi:hypothetical protein